MDVTHLLQQTIYVAACTGVDANGQATHSAPAARAARVEYGEGNLRSSEGTERDTTMRVVTLTAIGPRDRVWLPGVVPASASTTGYRVPAAGGSKPAPRLTTGAIAFYETEV